MTWPVDTLGSLIEADGGLLQTGPFGSQLKQAEYTAEGIPVIMPKDIANGEVNAETVARVPEATADRLSRHKIRAHGIVLPRRGAITKRAFIRPEQEGWLCGTGCIKIEATGRRIWPRYLYYYMGVADSVDWLEKNAVGSTMLNLSTEIVSRFPMACPEIEIQKRIASILSTYDNLIENNRRRIELLERAARELYREWFVRLRFPGHEHTKIVDGVPEGWERKKISNVCDTVGGGTPSTKVAEYWDGDVTWVVPTDVTKNDCLVLLDSARKITDKGLRESSAKMIPGGAILMTSRASVGFFALTDSEVCTNQGFINVIPHDKETGMYLLFNLMSRVAEIRSNAKGTTYPEISKGRFRDMDITVPAKILVGEFVNIASNIVSQVRCLKRSTRALSQARDLLLPRLMDSRIPV